MSRFRGLRMAVVVALLLTLMGCSEGAGHPSELNEPTIAPSSSDERIAASLTDLFQLALDTMDPSPEELEVIEQAITTGRIDAAYYEATHVRFIQCMAQYGFELPFRKTPEGVYIELPYAYGNTGGRDAHRDCSQDNSLIEILYRIQQANPDLLADQRLMAVQCLKKYNFVDVGYTVQDFDRDRAADSFPFDVYEDGPNNCLYTAGYAYFNLDDQ